MPRPISQMEILVVIALFRLLDSSVRNELADSEVVQDLTMIFSFDMNGFSNEIFF